MDNHTTEAFDLIQKHVFGRLDVDEEGKPIPLSTEKPRNAKGELTTFDKIQMDKAMKLRKKKSLEKFKADEDLDEQLALIQNEIDEQFTSQVRREQEAHEKRL